MGVAECQGWIARLTGQEFKGKTPPRLHQLQGIAAALYSRQILLRYDMQLGKTKMALDIVDHLKKCGLSGGTGLVFAHSPVGLLTWQNQAMEHSDLDVRIAHTKLDTVFDALEQEADLVVMTWSGMQQMFCEKRLNRKKQPTLYTIKGLLEELAPCFSLAIIDEIHKLKNPYSLWFEMASKLVKEAEWRIGLTGTLLNRDVFGIWAQIALLDGGARFGWNYQFFQAAFGKSSYNYGAGRALPSFDKDKLPIVSKRLATVALEYNRDETGLEVRTERNVTQLGMYGDQLQAYMDCLGNIIQNEGQVFEIEDSFMRLRQISSGFLPFTDTFEAKHVRSLKNNVKLEWLTDFLAEAPDDLPIIIFHEFTRSGQLISAALDKLKISHAWMYGGSTQAQDRESVAAFQAGRKRVFLTNSASGGTSITLNRADYVLFYESPVAPITRSQAEARPNAERGTRMLVIDDLVCSPTERKILGFLKEGKDLVHELRTAKDKRALLRGLSV